MLLANVRLMVHIDTWDVHLLIHPSAICCAARLLSLMSKILFSPDTDHRDFVYLLMQSALSRDMS